MVPPSSPSLPPSAICHRNQVHRRFSCRVSVWSFAHSLTTCAQVEQSSAIIVREVGAKLKLSIGWPQAVSAFGFDAAAKLAGPGDREAAIRAPLDALVTELGSLLKLTVVPFDEVSDRERGVRPDYAISVDGAITGYLEVKAPARGVDPARFTGHDLVQWERQRDLPNLIYTNGVEWRLWRDSDPVGEPVVFSGDLNSAGAALSAEPDFEALITDFLRWRPAPITSVSALVKAVAPLTRLLRGEVLDQLLSEASAVALDKEAPTPFRDLAKDWRQLLFPSATDEAFADGYAQSVTFALLLARSENIDLDATSLHEIGRVLGSHHSLMGKALQVLTDDVHADFKISLDLLVRVISAVRWERVRRNQDTYLHLYENFLDEYDPQLRKESGTYYTPRPVVTQMVRLTEEVLATRLEKAGRFLDESVVTVDPAMGTGTYLHAIIERAAAQVEEEDGAGAISGALNLLSHRLIGFELQMGAFAVAELRTTDLLRSMGASVPEEGLKLFVTDTLDDPNAPITHLGAGLELIARSRRRANDIKANQQVTVVIGNPPYRERAEGLGGWVETGDSASGLKAPLDDFRTPATGKFEHNLKNLYVYFWRWATQKVFDDFPEAGGIVCFISTAGYVRGPGFAGMRKYLRERASEGWVINVSPEGMRPPVNTRIFPGVQQPLAIGIFVRKPGTTNEAPAKIRYTEITGRRESKYDQLQALDLEGASWRLARTAWTSPFTPAAESDWDSYIALNEILPWTSPGVTANRRWPLATTTDVLNERWAALLAAPDTKRKSVLMKATSDRSLTKSPAVLPGSDVSTSTTQLMYENGPAQTPIRVGYRTLDRQWMIPDARIIDRPRPDLWRARIDGQIFAIEQHARTLDGGPGVVFSTLIPDLDHFLTRQGGGGRVLPLLHPNGESTIPDALLAALSSLRGASIKSEDLLAYAAGVASHSAFTKHFTDELRTPGVRIPITTDETLWEKAVELGRAVIWAQTYGEAFVNADANRPQGSIRLPADDPSKIRSLTAVTGLPDDMRFDADAQKIHIGTGSWGPVTQEMWDYEIGMRGVVTSWFNYRRADSKGRVTSPLDEIVPKEWSPHWTNEFTDLLSVIWRLTSMEAQQAALLESILLSPLITIMDLAAAGYEGATDGDKEPRRPLTKEETPTFDLGI